jgi:hypothetical protein
VKASLVANSLLALVVLQPGDERGREQVRRLGGQQPTRRGGRSELFLGIVKENPGITIAQVAKRTSVRASGPYSLQRALAKEREGQEVGDPADGGLTLGRDSILAWA